jgi:hypothetical protein
MIMKVKQYTNSILQIIAKVQQIREIKKMKLVTFEVNFKLQNYEKFHLKESLDYNNRFCTCIPFNV